MPLAESGKPTGVRRRLKLSVQAKRPQCGASEAARDLPPGIGQNVDRSVAWLAEIEISDR